MLRHLPAELRDAVLNALGPQWLMAFKLLLSYPTNTVGAWIEPRVLTLPDDCTAGEARDRIARSEQVEQARIYVLDRSGRLRGAVRGLALLQVGHRKKIASILEPADCPLGARPARDGAGAQRLGATHGGARHQSRRGVHRRHLVRGPAQSVP